MQNQTLPIAASPVAVAPVVNRINIQPNSDAAMFSQTLNREMAQRQSAAINAAPEPAAKVTNTPAAPAPAPAAPQGTRTDKHIANADASKDSTGDAAPAADSADAATQTETPPAGTKAAGATTTDATDPSADAASAAAAADGAAAAAPMADMLALVASYKQLLQGGTAGKTPAAADASASLKSTRGTGVAADAHTLATLQGALKKTDGAVADTGKDTAPGKPAATTVAAQADDDGKTVATPKTVPDVAAVATRAAPQSETALATLREAATTATVKDTAPVTGSAFQAQLTSAEMAQNAVTPSSNVIPARVGTTAWDTQVSQKVVWMVGGEDQTASLTLNPPDLGPVQVVLNVNNDQATVAFHSATPEVREALENAMPRLRDMLSDAGVTLGEASVSANMPDQRQADTNQSGNQNSGRGGNGNGNGNSVRSGETEIPIPRAARPVRSDGGLDTFA